LAEHAKIIHPDIRPGYDVTSNLLVKFDDATNKATMKIIDYESLVSFSSWEAPATKGKYLLQTETLNATTFVWWQCVIMAYVWMGKLHAGSLYIDTGNGSIMKQFKQALLTGGVVPHWMDIHRSDAKRKVSTAKVKLFLEYMLDRFKERVDE
jgi:hypothetical protein